MAGLCGGGGWGWPGCVAEEDGGDGAASRRLGGGGGVGVGDDREQRSLMVTVQGVALGGRGWLGVGGEAGLRKTPPLPLSSSEPGKVPRRMVLIGVEGKSVTAPSRLGERAAATGAQRAGGVDRAAGMG